MTTREGETSLLQEGKIIGGAIEAISARAEYCYRTYRLLARPYRASAFRTNNFADDFRPVIARETANACHVLHIRGAYTRAHRHVEAYFDWVDVSGGEDGEGRVRAWARIGQGQGRECTYKYGYIEENVCIYTRISRDCPRNLVIPFDSDGKIGNDRFSLPSLRFLSSPEGENSARARSYKHA